LKASGLGALAATTSAFALFGDGSHAAAAEDGYGPFTWLTPTGTTLDRTVSKGEARAGGYRPLAEASGEPIVRRTELNDTSDVAPVRFAISAFAQMTDLHVIDDQSPLRVEFVDRLANLPNSQQYSTDSAYRPHEMLSTHIVETMCRAIRNVKRGPKTGLPLAFTVVTGDSSDNVQYNETRWYINLLDGDRQIRADSGQIGVDESVSNRFGQYGHDRAYWFPEQYQYALGLVDDYQGNYGYPRVNGLLAAARQPYTSTGLGMPWYAAFGNHDAEIQGNLPVDPSGIAGCLMPNFVDFATSAFKPYGSSTTLPPDPGALDVVHFLDDLYGRDVTADRDRRPLTKQQFIAEHFATIGTPNGHGFGATPDNAVPFYAIPSGDNELVQYLVLDTTNEDGNAGGRITAAQWAWLNQQLLANSRRYLDTSGNFVTQSNVRDKLIVLFCHHTIDTINNRQGDSGRNNPPLYHYGDELKVLLLRFPNVILMVNGHTHANKITGHFRHDFFPGKSGGFFEVNTASHIDWPAQSRIVEIASGSGQISIFTTMVDIAAPLAFDSITTPSGLASLARELAANDPTERPRSRSGFDMDRNTQLVLPAPFPIADPAQPIGPWFFREPSQGLICIYVPQTGYAAPAANRALGMAPGTDASVAVRDDGSNRAVFRGVDSFLWQIDNNTSWRWSGNCLGVAAGTSPSVATFNGGYEIAFQANGVGTLWRVDPDDSNHNSGLPMRADSSPRIASSPMGGYLIVYVDDSGFLCQFDDRGNSRRSSNWLGVSPGTNPSIAAWPTGGYLIAFRGNDGNLWTVTDTGVNKNTQIQIAAGSSPSIAASMNGFVVAYRGTDGFLWHVGPSGVPRLAFGGKVVAANTSPGIYPHPSGAGFEVAFQGSGNSLWKLDCNGVASAVPGVVMATGSSPFTSYFINQSTLSGAGDPPPVRVQIDVPNVLSMDQDSAIAAMQAVGLVQGQIDQDNRCIDVGGTVLVQNPAAGIQSLFPGTQFNLTVSSGVDGNGRACVFK
jgi:metallophosphoesterase (TIGR03767 family)